MATAELTVVARERTGKGIARSLRRVGDIPAVVYGKGVESCSVSVNPKQLQQAMATDAGWNTLITLKGDGPFAGQQVILKDLQIDPIRRDWKHVDLYAVDISQKISVMVPVQPVGTAEGVVMGGNLEVIRHELEVICLPTTIPTSIEIDVTEMIVGDVLHVKDVAAPEGAEIPHDVNFTVLTVTGHKEEEVEEVEGDEAIEVEAPEADAETEG